MRWWARPPGSDYLFAIAATTVAVAVRWCLDPWLRDNLAVVTLLAAVAASVGFGGYRPALVAAILGYLACDVLFIEPRGSLDLTDTRHLLGLLAYLLTCSIIVGFGEALRNARHRAELQRESLRTTLASIGDAVIATDTEGRVTSMNAVAEALTGWTSHEAKGQSLAAVFRIINEHTRQPVENPVAKVLEQGCVVGLANHTILIAKDGMERPIDDSAAPIRCREGKIIGCVLVFHDVTERNRAENALRRSERELADFFENASVGLHWVGPDGRILRVNQTELNLLGYTREEYVGRHIAEFHVDQPIVEDILKRLAGGETIVDYEARLRCKDGSVRTVRICSNVLFEDGNFIHTRCLTRDVTELKSAEQNLRESEERYRSLTQAITSVIWTTDADGRFVAPQPSWAAFTGQTWGELQGFGWVNALHPDDRERVRHLVEAACASRTLYESDGRLWHAASGAYRHFKARGVPIMNAAGSIREWVGKCLDVEDRHQAEKSFEEASRRKDEFLAMLAHELRNPLAPIQNAVHLLRLTVSQDEALRTMSEMMERQVRQLVRLVDDLLDMSRITRGKIELRNERVELARVIEQAVEAAHVLVRQMEHELTVALPSEPIFLNADPARLLQVVGNLLNNACKFMGKGGRMTLLVEREGDRAILRVRDHGIGIAPDQLERVFEMFTQVDTSLERTVSGLGIGLTLVKNLVEMHGGTVTAHSSGLGSGSEFVVRLPILVEAAQQLPEPTVDRPLPQKARRILVVDDNQDAAVSLARLLKLTGHQSETAHDGLEAIAAAERFRPEVILLDIGLPKLNGYDACRRIREQPWGRDMVLVAVTGWGQEEDRRKSHEAGFHHHLVKPVEHDVLIKLLASQTGQSSDPTSTGY
jgi:PAS domain S-box-containing protein